jgi:hypothetical protein
LDVIEQFIKKKDNKAPNKVNMKGIFFNKLGANSASRRTKFSKLVVMDVKNNGVPTPINKSFEKKTPKNTTES